MGNKADLIELMVQTTPAMARAVQVMDQVRDYDAVSLISAHEMSDKSLKVFFFTRDRFQRCEVWEFCHANGTGKTHMMQGDFVVSRLSPARLVEAIMTFNIQTAD